MLIAVESKMLQRINSLSIKLFGVFLVTGLIYFYLLDLGVRSLILNEEVRDTLDYYQTSYLGNLMEDLGYPPNAEIADEVSKDMPFDILITGKNFEWSTTSEFPNIDPIDFQPSAWDSIKIKKNSDDGSPTLIENSEFARYQNRTYFRIPYGDYTVTMVVGDGEKPVEETQVISVTAGELSKVSFEESLQLTTSLTVHVPEKSTVWLAGNMTDSTGATRTFETSALPTGSTWENYEIRVVTKHAGGEQTVSKVIDLAAGDDVELSFEATDILADASIIEKTASIQ